MIWFLDAKPVIRISALFVADGKASNIGGAIKPGFSFSVCSCVSLAPARKRLMLTKKGMPNLNARKNIRTIPKILKNKFFFVFASTLFESLDLAIINVKTEPKVGVGPTTYSLR